MTYATLQDMVAAYGTSLLVQATDRTSPTPGTIDEAVVAAQLGAAGALIDSYLRGRYVVPVSPIPAELARVEVEIAWFYLNGPNAGEADRLAYDRQLRFLRDLADGRAGLTSAAPPAANGSNEVLFDAPPAVFSADRLDGY